VIVSGTVRILGERLVLETHGFDKILAFRSSITIPLKQVVSVSTERVGWTEYPGIRVGTSLPGVIRDGYYFTSNGLMFFEEHDPEKCITITLSHETYKKIVFQVEDKEAVAKLINAVIAPRC